VGQNITLSYKRSGATVNKDPSLEKYFQRKVTPHPPLKMTRILRDGVGGGSNLLLKIDFPVVGERVIRPQK